MLRSLLALYPEAPVAALESTGVLVSMPDSVPLVRNPILQARSGLDLLVEQDHVAVLKPWDLVLTEGVGRCRVHLAGSPPAPVVFHGFDLRQSHGVIVGVYVPADTDDGSSALVASTGEVTDALPRFASIRKDDRSFIIEVDRAITQILGWSAEEMNGRRSLDFIHPDDHPLAIDNWMQMLAHPGPARRVRLRHRRRDDTWAWLEVTNHSLLEDPDHGCVISEMVDISDEMAVHQALSDRERLFARIAETIPIGLFQIDLDRKITYTNDCLHTILAVDTATAVTAKLATVVGPDWPALDRALDRVLDVGSDVDIEVELQPAPGREMRVCTVNLRALRHDDGTISGAIGCVADVTDGVRMREQLRRRATLDELTGCYNRASIMSALDVNVASEDHDADRAVVFVDVDRFKQMNDQHGHAVGDELLRIVARRLQSALRRDDLIGRIGGDEFLVMCPSIGGSPQAMKLAERLARAVRHENVNWRDIKLQVSIGVAWSKGQATTADALVAQADRAMYQSKADGAGKPRLATDSPKPLRPVGGPASQERLAPRTTRATAS